MSTVVVLHAHPDDEAIFTGGTIALLADAGHRVVVVFATSGELGTGAGPGLAGRRREEARAACRLLGARRVVFLDHHDSGVHPDPAERPLGAFSNVAVHHAADHVAALLDGEGADVLVTYDSCGVYPHPDHLHVHRVGSEAARSSGLHTWYEVTVDREYLHFVDTHVAALAGAAVEPMLRLGSATVEITTTVDVRPVLARKLLAIAEHGSQVPDPTFGAEHRFPEVYGYEWFIRHGPAHVLEDLIAGAGAVTPAPTTG